MGVFSCEIYVEAITGIYAFGSVHATALLATNVFTAVAGDVATVSAFVARTEIPHIMQSLLKTGRWGSHQQNP